MENKSALAAVFFLGGQAPSNSKGKGQPRRHGSQNGGGVGLSMQESDGKKSLGELIIVLVPHLLCTALLCSALAAGLINLR